MRVGNLIARKKKFALKKERVEVGTIALVALIPHKICLKLGDKAQPDPHIRRTGLKAHVPCLRKLKDYKCALWSE